MTNESLQELISSWYTDLEKIGLEFTEEGTQFLTLSVHPEHLHQLMTQLKTNADTSFDYLFCLSGVDWGKSLGTVYHLESTTHRHIIVVKTATEDRNGPAIDTVSDLWKTADFHEREVFDFFGITFNNHPNLKRLFLTEDWVGYPLRKDYVDEANMVIK